MGFYGRILIGIGLLFTLVGGLMLLGERFGLGRLPGDLVFRRKGTTLYFPLASSLVLSLVLTLLLNLWLRRK